jgi:hypothetical protein
MDEESNNGRSRSANRLKLAGVAAAAVLAVPGGMAISNAFAADDGGNSSSPAQPAQVVPAQSESPAPQQRGDGGPGERGDRGDCPGKGGEGGGGSGSAEPGATGTGYTLQ